jgi:tetratricopeptide (TPR) repeat protein
MKLWCCGFMLMAGAWAQVPDVIGPRTSKDDFGTDRQIKLYQDWVSKDPTSISSRTLLAGAYIQKTRETTDFDYLNRAQKILDSVLSEKQDSEALHMRNVVELTLHHFSKAADGARALTGHYPGDVQSWGTLGDALMEMGQYDAGRDAFAKMLALKPGLASYNRMGFYRFVTGDVEGGIALMQDAVKAAAKYPENKAWCLVELGNMYFKTGKWDEAEAAFRDAIETFPASHTALAGLGSVQAARGQLTEAIASYEHAQSITPMVQYAGALFDLWTVLGKKEKAKEQADLVDVSAKLEEAAGFKSNRTLGLIYANQDRKLKEALEQVQTDFEIRKDIYTYDALAWVLYKNGRYEEARHASDEALKLGTPEALFHFHAGMIAKSLNDSVRAKAELEQALKLNPGFDVRLARAAQDSLATLAVPAPSH